MMDVLHEKDLYLGHFNEFEKETARHDRPALRRLRNAAIARFAELGFPKARNEDWRFTTGAPITQTPFRLLRPAEDSGSQWLPGERFQASAWVYLPDGRSLEAWAPQTLPNGVIVESLATALEKHPALVEPHLARHAKYDEHSFVALNTAFLRDGAFVYVPNG